MRAIPERLRGVLTTSVRGVFTTRRYTNPSLPLPLICVIQSDTLPVPPVLIYFAADGSISPKNNIRMRYEFAEVA